MQVNIPNQNAYSRSLFYHNPNSCKLAMTLLAATTWYISWSFQSNHSSERGHRHGGIRFPLHLRKTKRNSLHVMAAARPCDAHDKSVWIWTENKEVMTTAVERGWDTFLFSARHKALANEWSSIAKIETLFVGNGSLCNDQNEEVGMVVDISSDTQFNEVNAMAGKVKNIVISCLDWQIIPAENIVAAFQGSGTSTFAIAKNAHDAQVFFEALEKGVDGVVLHTNDKQLIFELKTYLDKRIFMNDILSLSTATITELEVMGMGDRVCVDLCSLLSPGEGILVGSFSRSLFLVHSECLSSSYISSRPFRVNAGPVHAYVAMPDGKTSYLSELESGQEILVVDFKGHQRRVIVGRVKIETRPLILVRAKIESTDIPEFSILLQNAETVSLVNCSAKEREDKKLTIPVSSMKVGDQVLVSLQEGARHTGLRIKEFIVEK